MPVALALAACDSALPPAADGTNLGACADGNCEVQVRTGSKIPHPGLPNLTVAVRDGTMRLESTVGDERNGSSMSVSGPPETSLQLGGQPFRVVAVLDEQGVLRVGG